MKKEEIGDSEGKIKLYGYYYQSIYKNTFENYPAENGRYGLDETKPIVQAQIIPMMLYANGGVRQVYTYSGNNNPRTFMSAPDECTLGTENTIEQALINFECDIKRWDPNGIPATRTNNNGVFRVSGDQITIQIYVQRADYFYLNEKYGDIIDSETFHLTKKYDYFSQEYTDIDELYHFKSMPERPQFSNFIFEKIYKP